MAHLVVNGNTLVEICVCDLLKKTDLKEYLLVNRTTLTLLYVYLMTCTLIEFCRDDVLL